MHSKSIVTVIAVFITHPKPFPLINNTIMPKKKGVSPISAILGGKWAKSSAFRRSAVMLATGSLTKSLRSLRSKDRGFGWSLLYTPAVSGG